MPPKKRHHYVPKCILQNFTDSSKKFFLFQLNRNQIISKSVPYADHCYTDYLYGKDRIREDWLGLRETAVSPIFQDIIKDIPISVEQINIVKEYILLQYMRTEKMIDNNNRMVRDIYEKLIPIFLKPKGIDVSPVMSKIIADEQVEAIDRSETVQNGLSFAEDNLSHFYDLRMKVLIAPQECSFICSDNPVFICNWFHPECGIGIDCAGLIVIMPISPSHCLMLYDDGLYEYEPDCHITISKYDIKKLNNIQYVNARNILFSLHINELFDTKNYFDNKIINNCMSDILQSRGHTDPILINRIINKIKEDYPQIISSIIPKQYARESFDGIENMRIKDEFIPYRKDINAMFYRFSDSEDISDKYSFVGEKYPAIIKQYLIQKGR